MVSMPIRRDMSVGPEPIEGGDSVSWRVPAVEVVRLFRRLFGCRIAQRRWSCRSAVSEPGHFRFGRLGASRRLDQSVGPAVSNGSHVTGLPRCASGAPALFGRRRATHHVDRRSGSGIDVGVLRFERAEVVVAEGTDPLGVMLRRAGRGDETAFAELYDRLAPVVYGVALKVVRDPSQSEEVAQEVFVELWRLAARYDGTKGSVTSWAATMAHRRAVDRVRSEQSSRNRVAREVSNVVRDHDDVVARMETTLDGARVRHALEQLSPLQREALELAYFGGHTYREVAVLLDVAEGTVKTRIRDGMIRLRDELGGTQ